MILKYLKYLFLLFQIFIFGKQISYAKIDLVLPLNNVSFSTELNQNFKSLEKELQPNIGFLKEKSRFVVPKSVSAQNQHKFFEYFVGNLANSVDDLASFINKSLADKLKHIDDIWKTKYPIPDMLGGRSFFEDVMGQYRYTKSSGWLHTGDISFNFKGIDFYKGTESANQIFANTAVSMKTTIQTDVNTWLNYQSIKDNIQFLREGMNPSLGIVSNGKRMFITDAKIHIYMPKANVTPTLKTQWMNKLNTDYPDIDFEIKMIEDFIN